MTLTVQNESSTKKKQRPFDYGESEPQFSLKNLDAEQMREINNLLCEYIEVPIAHSLPKMTLIPSPDMRPEALLQEGITEMERDHLA